MSPSIENTPSVTTRINRHSPPPGRPLARASLQDLAQRRDIGVRVDLSGRLGQPHAIDDRGVVERVRDDQVGLAGDRRDDPGVGGEAGLEGEDGRDVLERRQLGLERLVDRHRPGDRPDRAAPRPEFAHGLDGRVAPPADGGSVPGNRSTTGEMTRRSSIDTIGPWADDMTRNFR